MRSSAFPDHADTPALLLAFHTVSRSPSIRGVCHLGGFQTVSETRLT